MKKWVPVAWAFEVQPGEGRRVVVDGWEIGLWNVEGRLCALEDRCPHRGASLGEEGFLDSAGRIVCSWHDWV
ncbi:MAG: Rieske (2Fe-2S) protein, partial [Deltaproteobacteria bacterium]